MLQVRWLENLVGNFLCWFMKVVISPKKVRSPVHCYVSRSFTSPRLVLGMVSVCLKVVSTHICPTQEAKSRLHGQKGKESRSHGVPYRRTLQCRNAEEA